MFANVNTLAIAVENLPSFGARFLAFLTKFTLIGFTIGTIKPIGNFITAGNTKPISTNGESFEVVFMVGANRNFSVKLRVRPIRISAEAFSTSDINGTIIFAILFRFPEVRNVFEFGKFTLHQIAIKF